MQSVCVNTVTNCDKLLKAACCHLMETCCCTHIQKLTLTFSFTVQAAPHRFEMEWERRGWLHVCKTMTLNNTEECNKNLTQIDCKPSPICLRAIALTLSWDVLFRGSKKQISPVTRQPLIYFKRRLPSYFYANWLSLKNISLTFAFLLILPSVFLTAWCSAVFINKPTLSCVVCESDKLLAKQSTGVWISIWAVRGSKKPQSFSVGCNCKRFFIMHLCTFPLP